MINKHQTLNSVDILSAAGTVIAKVKGKEIFILKPWKIAVSHLTGCVLQLSGGQGGFHVYRSSTFFKSRTLIYLLKMKFNIEKNLCCCNKILFIES